MNLQRLIQDYPTTCGVWLCATAYIIVNVLFNGWGW